MQTTLKQIALAGVLTTVLATSVAFAEGPMNTDDAGTLDKGGMKIEGVFSRDNKERGGELVFGFGPIENVEVGLAFSSATDRDPDPSTKMDGAGIGIKWVPIQNETGWSLGVSFNYGRTSIDERSAPDRYTEKEYAFSGLASYRLANDQVLHTNLGSTRVKSQGSSESTGTWGIGYELPLLENLRLTTEIYGQEHSRPDKAVGLRYEIDEGLKVYGSVGRGSDRSFGKHWSRLGVLTTQKSALAGRRRHRMDPRKVRT